MSIYSKNANRSTDGRVCMWSLPPEESTHCTVDRLTHQLDDDKENLIITSTVLLVQ